MRGPFAIIVLAILAAPAIAGDKASVTASNGVVVNVNSDDFANHYEYNAPIIKIDGTYTFPGKTENFAVVAKIQKQNTLGQVIVQGILYSHDSPYEKPYYYGCAVFKGGDPADFTAGSRKPAYGCARYGCVYEETFRIVLTAEQIERHAENGVIPIKILAVRGSKGIGNGDGMLEIPLNHIEAVNEVARGGVQ